MEWSAFMHATEEITIRIARIDASVVIIFAGSSSATVIPSGDLTVS